MGDDDEFDCSHRNVNINTGARLLIGSIKMVVGVDDQTKENYEVFLDV